MPNADHAPCPAPPDGSVAFTHWLQACSCNPWAPLTPEAAKPYGFIWHSWLKYLAALPPASDVPGATPPAWHSATAVQLLAFINHHPHSHKGDAPSDITRRRYWRVLDRMYDHALLHRWVHSNPAQGLAAQDVPPSEDPKGAILSPRMWRALQHSLPAPEDLITTRDRAVLLLLMELGLTPQEVRELGVDHVLRDDNAPQRPICALQIDGERVQQSRVLPVSATLAQALQQWLAARNSYHAMQGQPALFCTRKAPQLSNHTLLHLVTKTLQAAAQRHRQDLPPRLGPQIIRNTVLVQWLEAGVPPSEVLRRAGMHQPHALHHLKAFLPAP